MGGDLDAIRTRAPDYESECSEHNPAGLLRIIILLRNHCSQLDKPSFPC